MTEDITSPEAHLADKIIGRLRTVYDPEIPVNLYDLGLIYRLDINRFEETDTFNVTVDMTLTSPGCPIADMMPVMVRDAIVDLPEIHEVTVELVWDPPWDKDRMSDEARFELNMF